MGDFGGLCGNPAPHGALAPGSGPEINLAGGRLAQLVERLLYTQNVGGSSPSPPTITTKLCLFYLLFCPRWDS